MTIQTLKLGKHVVSFYFVFKTPDNRKQCYDACLHTSSIIDVKRGIVSLYEDIKKSFPDYKVVSGGLLKRDVPIDVNVTIDNIHFEFKGKLNIPYSDVPISNSLYGVRVGACTEDFRLVNNEDNPYFSLLVQEQNMITDLYNRVFEL